VAKELNLISKSVTLKQFTTTKVDIAAAQFVSQQEQKRFEKLNTKLPDGQWIAKTDLANMKKDNPGVYKVFVTKGFSAGLAAVDRDSEKAEEANRAMARLQQHPAMVTVYRDGKAVLRPSKAGQIDIAAAYDAGLEKDIKLFFGDTGIKQIEKQKAVIAKLNPDKDGFINGVAHLRANPATGASDLKAAGFKDDEIKEWNRVAGSPIYLSGLFDEAFRVERNKLQKTTKLEPLERAVDYNQRVDGLAQVAAYSHFSEPEQAIITKERFLQAEVLGGTILGIGIGGYPGVAIIAGTMAAETGVHYSHMSAPDRVISVSTDLAMVALMLWGGRLLRPVVKEAIKGTSSFVSTTAGGVAKMERIVANAGKAGSKFNKTWIDYAKTAERVAANTKTLQKAAAEARAATTKAAQLKAATEQTMATNNLKANMLRLGIQGNATKAAETASRKADELFLKKLSSLKNITPKELLRLEKASGIPNLRSVIRGVSGAQGDLSIAWKYANKAKFYTNPKTPAQLEANVRHLMRMAEVQDAQYGLEMALGRANSTLQPRYPKYDVPSGIDFLEARYGVKMMWRDIPPDAVEGGGMSRTTKSMYVRTYEQLKTLRDAKVITEEEYKRWLLYLKARAAIPRSVLRLKPGQAATDSDILKAADDVITGKGGPGGQARYDRIKQISDESMAKYKAGIEADKKAAQTAVAERQKRLAEELAKAKPPQTPKPSQEGIPTMITRQMEATLKAKGFTQAQINKMTPLEAWEKLGKMGGPIKTPKVKPDPTKPVPFGMKPKPKVEEVEAKPETYQEKMDRLYGKDPLPDIDAYSKSVTKVLFATEGFTELTPKEWTQIKELIKAAAEAQTRVEVAGLTATQIRQQAKEAIEQKTRIYVKQQPLATPQLETRAAIITKVALETPLKPVESLKPKVPKKPPKKPPVPIVPLRAGKGEEKDWTQKEIDSAIAWKAGFVVHAIKSPYRRGIDEKSFHVDDLPEGLKVIPIHKGKGSAAASARVIRGVLKRKVTTDVGTQDVIISPHNGGRRVSVRHVRDVKGTVSQTTIKKGKSISKKKGRIFSSKVGGSEVLSRRPLRSV